MTWIRRLLAAAAVVALLAAVAAGVLAWRLHVFVTTPVAAAPEGGVLRYLEPARPVPPGPPAWEARARADQDAAFDLDTFREPPRSYAPWTRWWWPGNAVERPELLREVALLAEQGFAGVEIQPFGVGVSDADRAAPRWTSEGWDSPAFYENLRAVLEAARERGLGVDLNNGSGWPTGGPQVAFEDGMRSLVHGERLLAGPARFDDALPAPDVPVAYYTNAVLGFLQGRPSEVFLADARELVAVVAGRVLADGRTASPLDLTDQVALDPASIVDLTPGVVEGRLAWDVPEGRWALVALWQLPGGEHVSADASPRPVYVVDHLDAERVRANQDYLLGERTGLPPYFGRPLRAYFDDSLEFKQERHWARGMLEAFETRRGYDPRPWLPALVRPGADQMFFHAGRVRTAPAYDLGEDAARFVEDWEQTTSDLFLERFLDASGRWAAEHGLAHRAQVYGAPIDVLQGAGHADIPEAEQLYADGSELFLKAVSSGAHLYDRPLVSAESFVAMLRAFMTTPAKLKALADKAFGSGINQIVYHGTAYHVPSPESRGYPPEGWYPWVFGMFSTDWSEASPFFRFAPRLNRYMARVQYALRLGRPETDVLVLYPGLGFPQGFTNPGEVLAGGRFTGEPVFASGSSGALTPGLQTEPEGSGAAWLHRAWKELRGLEQRGLAWEWVNEDALRRARLVDDALEVGAQQAGSLLLFEQEALAPETAEQIAALAEAGLPVRVVGPPPARQRGLHDRERGDARVRAAMLRVARAARERLPDGLLRYRAEEVRTIRRRLVGGDRLVFVRTTRAKPETVRIAVAAPFAHASRLDPWTGQARPLEAAPDGSLALELGRDEATFLMLQASGPPLPDTRPPEVRALDGAREVARYEPGSWTVRVEHPAPGAPPYQADWTKLVDWRDVPALHSCSSEGSYRATLKLPAPAPGHRFLLEVTWVAGVAEVRVNGAAAGDLLGPPNSLDVTELLQGGDNTLELILTPPRRNALVPRIERGEPGFEVARFLGATHRVATGVMQHAYLRELAPTEGFQN